MKKYLICWCFLDQGMEGIPDLSDACIIEAKDEKTALKKFPKEIKKLMKGYGGAIIIGESLKRIILDKSKEKLQLPLVLPIESMEGITE